MTNETETPMIPMIQVAQDFRRARYAEWCGSQHLGKFVALLQCETGRRALGAVLLHAP